MNITINGETVGVSTAFVSKEAVNITKKMEIADALKYDGAVFGINGESYQTDGIMMITNSDDGVSVMYKRKDETEELRAELEEKDSEISNIRTAIKNLGTGIPTLSKLIDFLAAVKEAIKYE